MPQANFAAEPEWSVLIAACSPDFSRRAAIPALLRSRLGWDRLFELSESHGLQPFLYQALEPYKKLIPSEHFSVLLQTYQRNVHKALILSRELIRVIDALAASGIEIMAYKGPVLAEAIYGDIALRQAGDMDLLIHRVDFGRIRRVLSTLGYKQHVQLSKAQEHAYLGSGYECAFDGTAGRNLLEVQWAVQPRFYAVDLDNEELFRRAVPVAIAGREVKTLSFEDLFIVLSLHAAKHVWGRVIWLCDLARIMNMEKLNWVQIASCAKNLRIVRILWVNLVLANRILGVPIPSEATACLPTDGTAKVVTQEIESHILSERVFDVESVGYFRLMQRLRESRRDRLRFLSRLILMPGPGEWSVIRLPSSLFPLYRLLRICRLAAKLARF